MSTDVAAGWCCVLVGTDKSVQVSSGDVFAHPDDVRKHHPKHVELIKVNKSKLLHLVGYQL